MMLLVVVLGLLFACVIWWFSYQSSGRYFESTNDAFVQADSVTVSPKVSGYIDKVFVQDNQDVAAGQPLFQVDPLDYQAQVSQYEAQTQLSLANADDARAKIAEQEAVIEQAQAQHFSAISNARYTMAEVRRYEPLVATGAESSERLSQLRNEAAKAAALQAQQQAVVRGAERRVASLQSQVRQAEAQGGAARAQLRGASRNVASTLIRASIAGRIGDKQARVGQFVQAGSRLTTIVPLSQIYVAANFKETQIGLMRVGQPVDIEVDALPDIILRGHVVSLSPGTGAQFSVLPPQNATGNFTKIVQRITVRIAIDAGPQARALLVPGMSVKAIVNTISAREVSGRIKREQDARAGSYK
ncbi:membrane fusion protein (multidrug efflux system) [Sphingobium boeckii]|uniref:Membrane fusion protein (Multidrug efflux system) n=2 Tax=Sphingobium boeckii TaxID=1082345 RepID=A0A7W9ED09_9SPHN|nr:membrane fusion protein (multidrug efflux system) [Sphingobium boeckii]